MILSGCSLLTNTLAAKTRAVSGGTMLCLAESPAMVFAHCDHEGACLVSLRHRSAQVRVAGGVDVGRRSDESKRECERNCENDLARHCILPVGARSEATLSHLIKRWHGWFHKLRELTAGLNLAMIMDPLGSGTATS